MDDSDLRAELTRRIVERLKESPEYAEMVREWEAEDMRLMYGDGSKPKPRGVLRVNAKGARQPLP